MRRHVTWVAFVVGLTAVGVAAGCGGEEVAPGAITADSAPAATAPLAEGAMGHGSHDPKHGGVVLMSDAYHFEVILNPAGKYELYFTDMARNDLPATTAVKVTITVTRPGGAAPESIPMKIDESGEGWAGAGQPVENLETIARMSYWTKDARDKEKPSYFMDLPFSAAQPKPPAPPPALARPAEGK